MNMTIAAAAVGRATRRRGRRCDDRWREGLPAEWAHLTVMPVRIDEYRDYEADAARMLGRDEDGEPCFTKHRFVRREPCSDDGEDFYTVISYGELMTAWRLSDGRWLMRRIVVREGEIEDGRSFYALSESMPR
jgi:hypothetical protein